MNGPINGGDDGKAPEAPSGLEARSKAVFDASVDGLNANVRSRLTQARFAAVGELERKTRPRWLRVWMPVAGLVTAALVVALIVVPGMNRTGHSGATVADDDIPLLLEDNIEMIEDMEFYAWLDDQSLDDDGATQPAVAQPDEPARS